MEDRGTGRSDCERTWHFTRAVILPKCVCDQSSPLSAQRAVGPQDANETPTLAPNTSCTSSWSDAEGWESGPLLVTGCRCYWGNTARTSWVRPAEERLAPAECLHGKPEPGCQVRAGRTPGQPRAQGGAQRTSPQPCPQPGARRQTSHVRHALSFNKDTSRGSCGGHTGT